MRRRQDRSLMAADAKMDQIVEAIMEGARADIPAWAELAHKLDAAADTRAQCAMTMWTEEEMYQVVRLAHAASGIITGRLLGRPV